MHFGDSSNRDEKGVLLENKAIYAQKLNENLLVKQLPLILAQSLEFQNIGARDEAEVALLKKLKENDDIDQLIPKGAQTKGMNFKPLLLILGHMLRDETVRDPVFKEGLNEILKHGANHMNMMLETVMEINKAAMMGAPVKRLGWRAIQSIIEF